MADTIFNTRPGAPATTKMKIISKVIRSAKRVMEGDFGGRPLTMEEVIKAALAGAGVTGSLSTLGMQAITSKIRNMVVEHNQQLEGEEANPKRPRIFEAGVDADGSLLNIPSEAQDTENRLVQVNTGGNRGTKRLREGDMATNAPTAVPMDEDPDQLEATRAPGPGGNGNNPQSKETPITPAPSISYGLPETHTTIIPWNFWFSQTYNSYPGALALPKLSFRLNSIDDIVASTITNVTSGSAYGTGTHNVPYEGTNSRGGGTPTLFPRTLTVGTSVSEQPFWAAYWKKLYEYYTVLGCEYKITAHNPTIIAQTNSNALILYDMDSHSDAVGATGNKTPDAVLPELMSYKHMRIKAIAGQGGYQQNSNHEPYEVIQGRHKPGQIARNISNDGDVKTWTKTDGSIPTLKELMNIRTGKSPFFLGAAGDTVGVNYQVEVKYIVQFKDLKESARYPRTGGIVLQPTLPVDALDAV
uniref:Capsid protein n=1 Tax=Parvoviridae sp. TaxID=1940570 RepID=A0A7D3V4F1_9VIRU|nr:MAG: capsid protein [Parvoviridae sp.]